jgi:hypothetical protein
MCCVYTLVKMSDSSSSQPVSSSSSQLYPRTPSSITTADGDNFTITVIEKSADDNKPYSSTISYEEVDYDRDDLITELTGTLNAE